MKKILLGLTFACLGIAATSYAQTIQLQNFESGMTPWTVRTVGGGGGWAVVSGITPTQLGPINAHTHYAVVNEGLLGTGQYNDPTEMYGPAFSLVGYANPYLSYDWVYFQAWLSAAPHTAEQAWIEISTDGGTTFALLDSILAPASGDWETKFISLSAYTGDASCVLRFCYTDNGAQIIGVAVDNINVFNAQANDISMVSVTPVAGDPGADFGPNPTSFTIGGIVRNISPTAMTAFSASYSVAGGAAVTTPFTGLSIAPMATYTFTCTPPYADATTGSQGVQVWATVPGDPNTSNDSGISAVNIYTNLPNKIVTFEEGTGMWCGYCVRGIIFMDSLEKNDSASVNIVAVHDQLNGTDELAAENTLTADYDKFVSYFPGFTGYPGVLVDRRYVIDPSDAFTYHDGMTSYFGYADVTSHFTITPASGSTAAKINVSGTVTPGIQMTGSWGLALVISEDNVHNNSYYQHDYYSNDNPGGSAGPLYGVGYNFQDSVFSIAGSSLYFKFVARYSNPDMYTSPGGLTTFLPTSMDVGSANNFTFPPISIASDWNPIHLRATVMLIDNNATDNTYMQILNSSGHVSPLLGVSNTTAGIEKFTVFPNPAKEQAHAYFSLNATGMVRFAIYDALGREVFGVPAETMQQGDQQINFSTANLPSGIYVVSLSTATGTLTQNLSVLR